MRRSRAVNDKLGWEMEVRFGRYPVRCWVRVGGDGWGWWCVGVDWLQGYGDIILVSCGDRVGGVR